MKIAIFTNTYHPHVGGVAKSVQTFEEEFRNRGHRVRIIAPRMEDEESSREDVLRVPSIQNFNGSGFAMSLPQPFLIPDFVDEFQPEVVHSHHPFLLGDAALRIAYGRQLPLIFTHHTMYEQYTHNLPVDGEPVRRIAIQIATEYCNLCHHVIAPSRSVESLLRSRGVLSPISVIPTGIDLQFYGAGHRKEFRQNHGIPQDAVVIGHTGRLTEEKNLRFLSEAVGIYLQQNREAKFLVVGEGELTKEMKQILDEHVDPQRYAFLGRQVGQNLADAYAAMDVFVFSSQSETQGMVVAEALAAGNPVVALDGPGVREVVTEQNGRLLPSDASPSDFASAVASLTDDTRRLWRIADQAKLSVEEYGISTCTNQLMQLYQTLIDQHDAPRSQDLTTWDLIGGRLEAEWKLMVQKASALTAAVVDTQATSSELV